MCTVNICLPICFLTLFTCFAVFLYVIHHSKPVESLRYLYKCFVTTKVPSTKLCTMATLQNFMFFWLRHNLQPRWAFRYIFVSVRVTYTCSLPGIPCCLCLDKIANLPSLWSSLLFVGYNPFRSLNTLVGICNRSKMPATYHTLAVPFSEVRATRYR